MGTMDYNIAQEIQDLAEELTLGIISTGGGCDYVYIKFHNGMEAILTGTTGDGSPYSLKDRATVQIFKDSDWTEAINIEFATAKRAMKTMATMTSSGEWQRGVF